MKPNHGPMHVALISEDRDLFNLCRETLAGLPGLEWSISVGSPGDFGADADLYVWDVPAPALPEGEAWDPTKHLFLAGRRDAAEVRSRTGSAGVSVLLKPVTRATLSAFLGLAAAARRERTAVADFLREDRDQILQCLIETNLRMQEYDQDRTNFLARALHDFRAPLTAVVGYCGLLLEEPLGALNERQREVLRRMQRSARRLSRMATAMFELSVGRQVRRAPDIRPGDLRETVEQAVHEMSPFAGEKRLSISTEFAPCERPVLFDAGQVEQALVNLLDNACKFTPKAGSIEIYGYPFFWERRCPTSRFPVAAERRRSASGEPNVYRIDVINSGIPIPEGCTEAIFEEYTSYGGVQDRSGGGLGLAICRMIANQHGGRVFAENTPAGPKFSFLLPLGGVDAGGAGAELALRLQEAG